MNSKTIKVVLLPGAIPDISKANLYEPEVIMTSLQGAIKWPHKGMKGQGIF